MIMNIQEALQNQQLKKRLESKKAQKVKKRILQKQRQKANLDNEALKVGKIQKSKPITKKLFATEVQKGRKIDVVIQQNANPNTFVSTSQEYLNILNRTKKYITFDQGKLQTACKAILAYSKSHKQQLISLQLQMQKDTKCNQAPVLLRLAHPQPENNCIVITNSASEIETKILTQINMRIMSVKQFTTSLQSDNSFRKKLSRQGTKLFCDWNVFTKSKLPKKLLKLKLALFPIDLKKVPFSLQKEAQTYQDYIKILLSSSIAIAKSGSTHRLNIRSEGAKELQQNLVCLTHQMVAKLIQKDKQKGNKLLKAKLKTETSIPIEIYG